MAKRNAKQPRKDESADAVLRQWQAELVETIRPYLIEPDGDIEGEFYIALTYDSDEGRKTYCVATEFFESDDSNDFRRTVSAIEAIDTVRQSGGPITTTGLYAAILLGRRFTELNEKDLFNKAELIVAGNRRGGQKSKELTTDSEKLLLKTTFAQFRDAKDRYKKIGQELFTRHGVKSKRKRRGDKAISGKTIKRRLEELGILDNSSVVSGQQ